MKLKSLFKELAADDPLAQQIGETTKDNERVKQLGLFGELPPAMPDLSEDPMIQAITSGELELEVNERIPVRKSRKQRVDCAREGLAQLAAKRHDHPSRKLRVVGIAGGSECSTIAFMVRHVMEIQGIRTGLLTPIRNDVHQSSERVIYSIERTAEAEVHAMMSRMLNADCEACVFETDLESLSNRRSMKVDFDIAIYSNLSEESEVAVQSRFQSRLPQEYREYLRNAGIPTVTVNRAHKSIVKTLQNYELVMTYDFTQEFKLEAQVTSMSTQGTSMRVRTPKGEFRCRIPQVGSQNIFNALAAVGICMKLGIEEKLIGSALQTLPMVPGHLERLNLDLPFDLFIDEARTEGALAKVIATLSELTEKRLLIAFGCHGHQRGDVRMGIGKRVAQLADFSIITTDNPRNESPLKIAAEVAQGFIAQENFNFKVELDRELAVKTLIEMAQPGDVLLIAGKGHERFQEVEDAVVPFDDRIYAREMAESLRPLLRL